MSRTPYSAFVVKIMRFNPTKEVGDRERCDTDTDVCDTDRMPTTRPRYTITDTGETAELLDLAARAWPEVEDRRELLKRLLAAGREVAEREASEEAERRERRRRFLREGPDLVDLNLLLSDAAWR